jgi:hypothetical protein
LALVSPVLVWGLGLPIEVDLFFQRLRGLAGSGFALARTVFVTAALGNTTDSEARNALEHR